jgi:signal transduction histidine kinase
VIDVSLVFTQDMLLMEVRDNGIGFEVTPEVLNSNGLKNIRNRCLLLNATYQLESNPGKGTRITFQMPYLY